MGILSSFFGTDKLRDASRERERAITESAALARPELEQGFGQAVGALQPFAGAGQIGTQALGRAQTLLGLAGSTAEQQAALQAIQDSPLQQFRLKEAQRALNRQAAATGLTGSGALTRQSAEVASNIAAQGQQEQLQNLLGLAGSAFAPSLPAAQQIGSLQAGRGQALADLSANTRLGVGGVRAGALEGEAQRRAQAASGLLGLAGTGVGAFLGGPVGAQLGGTLGRLF